MINEYSDIRPAVTAVQYLESNKQEILEFAGKNAVGSPDQELIKIYTLNGFKFARVNDWIVQGKYQSFDVMKNDAFDKRYKLSSTAETTTTEPSEDQAKRILGDLQDIQGELKLTTVHMIELEKYLMLTLGIDPVAERPMD